MNRVMDTLPAVAGRLKSVSRVSACLAAAALATGCGEPANRPVMSGVNKVTPQETVPVIAIDPGHGPNRVVVDRQTGLKQVESRNEPETDRVWSVALRVKNSLRADGYVVAMLKASKDENVTFRQRAERAAAANAALAVSIHGDPNLPNTGQLFPQEVGLYRGSGPNKTVFQDADVALLSQRYTTIIQGARQKIEGPDIVTKTNDFSGRAGLDPGNIPMVQLLSDTPWVYSEKRMPFDDSQYSLSLVKGIEAAVPNDR